MERCCLANKMSHGSFYVFDLPCNVRIELLHSNNALTRCYTSEARNTFY